MHDFKGIRQNTKFFYYKNLTLDLKSLKIFGQKSEKLGCFYALVPRSLWKSWIHFHMAAFQDIMLYVTKSIFGLEKYA